MIYEPYGHISERIVIENMPYYITEVARLIRMLYYTFDINNTYHYSYFLNQIFLNNSLVQIQIKKQFKACYYFDTDEVMFICCSFLVFDLFPF